MSEFKLCKDCKHFHVEITKGWFSKEKREKQCLREFSLVEETSPVTGKPTKVYQYPQWLDPSPRDPQFERWNTPQKGGCLDGSLCTPEAIFWEPK